MEEDLASNTAAQKQARKPPIPPEKLNIDRFAGEKLKIFQDLLTNEEFQNSRKFKEECDVAQRLTGSNYEDRGRY
jgi:hypothetical protein